jgi:hypothetical protein
MNMVRSCNSESRPESRRESPVSAIGLAIGLAVALLTGLVGCHAFSPRPPSSDRPPSPSPAELGDASYDWHGLVIAPFGSVLKEVPLTLHEVLLFRDEAHHANAADEAECYAASTPAPRFVGRIPDEYLLCFKQDRLSRVQASVRLSAAVAPAVFASACARWSRQTTAATANAAAERTATAGTATAGAATTGAATTGVSTGGASAEGDSVPTPAPCAGRDGAIRFNAHLEAQSTQATSSPGEQVLSITLDGPPAP